jgi:hypothetical protein
VFDSLRAIKSGKIRHVAVFLAPDEIRKVRTNIDATWSNTNVRQKTEIE